MTPTEFKKEWLLLTEGHSEQTTQHPFFTVDLTNLKESWPELINKEYKFPIRIPEVNEDMNISMIIKKDSDEFPFSSETIELDKPIRYMRGHRADFIVDNHLIKVIANYPKDYLK